MSSNIKDCCDPCSLAYLDLFQPRYLQTDIEDVQYVPYMPTSTIEHGAPIKIYITGTTSSYILLKPIAHFRWKIMDTTGAHPPDAGTSKVTVINALHHTAFNSITVHLNNLPISTPTVNDHLVGYVDCLLNSSDVVKKSTLENLFWYKDESGKFANAEGEGFKNRMAITNAGTFETYGEINHSLFKTGAVLPSGVDLSIQFHRNPDTYVLIDLTPAEEQGDSAGVKAIKARKYKLQLLEAIVYVPRIRPTAKKLSSDAQLLENQHARIFMNKVDVKSLTIPNAVSTKSFHSIYTGPLPKRVLCFMIPNATSGYEHNGLDFQANNLRNISVSIGARKWPIREYAMDFAKGIIAKPYADLFDALNLEGNCADIGLTKKDFKDGFTIFGWDLTTSKCASSLDHMDAPREGSMSIDMQFRTPTTSTLSLIVLSEFTNVIEFDKYRNVRVIEHFIG